MLFIHNNVTLLSIFSYTVPKKEATEFTREVAQKTEQSALKAGRQSSSPRKFVSVNFVLSH